MRLGLGSQHRMRLARWELEGIEWRPRFGHIGLKGEHLVGGSLHALLRDGFPDSTKRPRIEW